MQFHTTLIIQKVLVFCMHSTRFIIENEHHDMKYCFYAVSPQQYTDNSRICTTLRLKGIPYSSRERSAIDAERILSTLWVELLRRSESIRLIWPVERSWMLFYTAVSSVRASIRGMCRNIFKYRNNPNASRTIPWKYNIEAAVQCSRDIRYALSFIVTIHTVQYCHPSSIQSLLCL